MTAPDNSREACDGVLPFCLTARVQQRKPPGDWRTWLFMGGRGAGKTRAGAEWVRFAALFGGCSRIALVAPTLSDGREVMIEGVSGLRRIARAGETAPHFEVSRRRLVWPNGAQAHIFSAEDADSLRGPQFDAAWCDELAAWRDGEAVWDMLQMGLRLGTAPRIVATTTPRPVPLIRRLVAAPSVALTRSTTADNRANLSSAFLAHVEGAYANTSFSRQELGGELLDEVDGALWSRDLLERARRGHQGGSLADILVAVDPPVSSGARADACGIVAAAIDPEGRGHVLADATVQGLSPLEWAGRVVALAQDCGASRIIAEANQGGELVRTVLEAAGCTLPISLQHARLNKRGRAMPVVALYETSRVSHRPGLTDLEEEMLVFGTSACRHSPDRVDALVWALTVLLIQKRGEPGIRSL